MLLFLLQILCKVINTHEADWRQGMVVMNQVAAKIKGLGMHTFVRWNWVFIAPSLTLTASELDEGVEIISKSVEIADKYCN